ncbi:MAG: hypothetical protein LC104_18540 [Bacteroidales bacterium]|nr:hypothetical protein [Bacteroidales bacterium]
MRCLFALPLMALVSGVALAADPKPVIVKVNKLAAPVPAGWVSEKPANRLRSFQFRLPAATSGGHTGEMYVMPDSNPDYAKYFTRWKRDFVVPEGKTADDLAKTSNFDLPGGTTIHLLDMSGTWRFKERPFDPRSKTEERPDSRVVWVVVAGPDAACHLRLSGPAAVVAQQYDPFIQWLKSLK